MTPSGKDKSDVELRSRMRRKGSQGQEARELGVRYQLKLEKVESSRIDWCGKKAGCVEVVNG